MRWQYVVLQKTKPHLESLSLQDVLLWCKLFKLNFLQNVITKHFQTCSKESKTTKYDETTKNIKYFQIILALIGSYCDEDESPFVTPRDSKETEQKQGHTRNKVKYNLYIKQLKKSNYKKEKNNIECNSQVM